MASQNQVQVIQQVRFALNQLAIRNGHHEFEELCRHLTRARICSNVIPASGPVSAGGDQGRDFETFRTYLNGLTGTVSAFLALTRDEDLVGACTLQQDGIPSKIRSDLRTILGSGNRPAVVYYFCEADVPVARRHELQEEARTGHELRLEILDGHAIAEMLTSRDIFWIASQYLHLPMDILPEVDLKWHPSWYADGLLKWRPRGPEQPQWAEFLEIRALARHAMKNEDLKADLPLWLERLGAFLQTEVSPLLQRKAQYEIAVVALRGLGTLVGREDLLRKYFAGVAQISSAGEIEDAHVLLTYCATAEGYGLVHLGNDLKTWLQCVHERISALLEETTNANLKCALYEALGMLAINRAAGGLKNVDDAVAWWLAALELAPHAVLWSANTLAQSITIIAPALEPLKQYDSLTTKLDAIIAQRSGTASAAGLCRDRAIKLYNGGKYRTALRDFHRAKEGWFTGESLRGSLLSMSLIGHCYAELGQDLAAKYYWLGMAFAASRSQDADDFDLIAVGVLDAANCDYRVGAWWSFLELARLGSSLRVGFVPGGNEIKDNDQLEAIVFHQAIVRRVVRTILPNQEAAVVHQVRASGTLDMVEELVQQKDPTYEGDLRTVMEGVRDKLGSPPFADCGQRRTLAWRALGVEWRLSFSNRQPQTLAAERFATVLQILLVDLADSDIAILPTTVDVEIEVGPISDPHVEPLASNIGRRWHVVLGTVDQPVTTPHDLHRQALGVASAILSEITLLPSSELEQLLDERFRGGLVSAAVSVNSYDVISRSFRVNYVGSPAEDIRLTLELAEDVNPAPHDTADLRWRDGPGPTYDVAKAEEYLRRRYEMLAATTRYTVPRLRAISQFADVVASLRADGWLDWQILAAISALASNYRMDARHLQHDRTTDRSAVHTLLTGPEPDDPVPTDLFTEPALREVDTVTMLATLKTWGLELRQLTPDFEAIRRFMRVRYRHWTDDVQHVDPFPQEGAVGAITGVLAEEG